MLFKGGDVELATGGNGGVSTVRAAALVREEPDQERYDADSGEDSEDEDRLGRRGGRGRGGQIADGAVGRDGSLVVVRFGVGFSGDREDGFGTS